MIHEHISFLLPTYDSTRIQLKCPNISAQCGMAMAQDVEPNNGSSTNCKAACSMPCSSCSHVKVCKNLKLSQLKQEVVKRNVCWIRCVKDPSWDKPAWDYCQENVSCKLVKFHLELPEVINEQELGDFKQAVRKQLVHQADSNSPCTVKGHYVGLSVSCL